MKYKFLADMSPCFAQARMRAVDVTEVVAVTYSGVRLRMHEQPRGLTHSNRTQREFRIAPRPAQQPSRRLTFEVDEMG